MPPEIFELINPPLQIKLMSIQTLFYGDIIWLAFLLTSFMICTTKQWKGNKNFLIHSFFQTFYICLFGCFLVLLMSDWDKKPHLSDGLSALFQGHIFLGVFLKALNRTFLKTSYLRFYFWGYYFSNFLILELYHYNSHFFTKKIGDQIVY